jgi:hypothetical protein
LFSLSAGLRHSFTSRTLAQLDFARSSQESDFPDNPYYLRTALDVGVSQRFTTKLYGRAAVQVSLDSYPNETSYENPYDPAGTVESGKRSDGVVEARLAVGFDATRWLALELAGGVQRRSSNFDTFDYDATRVSLSAKAAF